MFCPRCGRERISEETNYCNKCGFLLTTAADLVQTGGLPLVPSTSGTSTKLSPRRRGVKHGLFILLLTFLVVPMVAMLSVSLRLDPTLAGAASVLFFMGGIIRIVYAWMFESAEPGGATLEEKVLAGATFIKPINPIQPMQSLPSADHHEPAADFVKPASGRWLDTNDLQPASITENTTRHLKEEERP